MALSQFSSIGRVCQLKWTELKPDGYCPGIDPTLNNRKNAEQPAHTAMSHLFRFSLEFSRGLSQFSQFNWRVNQLN